MSTYAYITVNLDDENNTVSINTFNKNLEITYIDTSNISMVNAYTGQKIIKTFSIKNTGDGVSYYDIILDKLVNDFSTKSDLVYTLTSDNNGAYVSEKVVPSESTPIAKNVRIDKGVTHNYELTITFLQTNVSQNDNMNKTFSSNILIESSKGINAGKELFDENTIGRLLTDNIVGGIDSNDYSDVKDGVYYTNNAIEGITTYFFRGSKKLNNYVLMGDKCYKIVRTTENNGVKLILFGDYVNDKCERRIIETRSTYNENSNYNAYVGYMYGNVSSGSYEAEHKNNLSSNIKRFLDSWYTEYISEYNDIVDKNTIFCNNRQTIKFTHGGVSYDVLGYSDFNTGYEPMNNYYLRKGNVSFDCNLNDRFSADGEYGNKVLDYPIGLLTVEELYYGGFEPNNNTKAKDFKTKNTNNYLHIQDNYYTMSSAYYNGQNAYVFAVNSNRVIPTKVTTIYHVRPVIGVKGNSKILSGTGTIEDPYVLAKKEEKSDEE